MFIKHPTENAIINIEQYTDVRTCPKNPTHIDFYLTPQAEGERGTPDYTMVFKTKKARDEWFSNLRDALVPADFDLDDIELEEE